MAFGFFKKKKSKVKTDDNVQKEHYHKLRVKEVIKETADAISIVFEQPATKIEYQSGQFLTLIVDIDGKSVRRAYSLSSSPVVDDDLAVTIKRVEGGLMSNFLYDNVKEGDEIDVMEPMGNFTTEFSTSNKRHIIMFGGGSGITPLMSIAKSALKLEPDSVVSLIYCNRNLESIIFKDSFQNMENVDEGRLHVIHVLDQAPLEWQGHTGLLNHDMLTKLFERIPDWGKEDTDYFMCGPEGMMNNVETLLKEKKVPLDKIVKESFVAGIINKSESDDNVTALQEQNVTIIYDDEEHVVTVGTDASILEAALDNGIDLPYSCQSGLCTACRGKCTSGNVKMDEDEGLSDAEKEEGYVLLCVGHPLTNDVKIEIG